MKAALKVQAVKDSDTGKWEWTLSGPPEEADTDRQTANRQRATVRRTPPTKTAKPKTANAASTATLVASVRSAKTNIYERREVTEANTLYRDATTPVVSPDEGRMFNRRPGRELFSSSWWNHEP